MYDKISASFTPKITEARVKRGSDGKSLHELICAANGTPLGMKGLKSNLLSKQISSLGGFRAHYSGVEADGLV
jgi:hypothetical protein